jgi:hypothetical protein
VFRIRLVSDGGSRRLAATLSVTGATAGAWQSLSIPLDIGGQTARQILLETGGPPSPAYWSTPRLTLD